MLLPPVPWLRLLSRTVPVSGRGTWHRSPVSGEGHSEVILPVRSGSYRQTVPPLPAGSVGRIRCVASWRPAPSSSRHGNSPVGRSAGAGWRRPKSHRQRVCVPIARWHVLPHLWHRSPSIAAPCPVPPPCGRPGRYGLPAGRLPLLCQLPAGFVQPAIP